jgi:transposase
MDDLSALSLRIITVRRGCRRRFETIVSATSIDEPTRCPKCGDLKSLYRHGRKTTVYRDLPQPDGVVIAIEVERLRFRCIACGGTSLQPLETVDRKFRTTQRLVERILSEAVKKPITAVAAAFSIDEKTVRRVVRDRLPRLTTGRANGLRPRR